MHWPNVCSPLAADVCIAASGARGEADLGSGFISRSCARGRRSGCYPIVSSLGFRSPGAPYRPCPPRPIPHERTRRRGRERPRCPRTRCRPRRRRPRPSRHTLLWPSGRAGQPLLYGDVRAVLVLRDASAARAVHDRRDGERWPGLRRRQVGADLRALHLAGVPRQPSRRVDRGPAARAAQVRSRRREHHRPRALHDGRSGHRRVLHSAWGSS